MGNVLSPEQREQLAHRMVVKADYEKYVFDGKLYDALSTLFPSSVMKVVHDSVKDERCSKQFYHKEAMMDTVAEFVSDAKVRDARGTKSVRAARVLLSKILPNAKLIPRDIDKESINLFSNQRGAAGAIGRGTKQDNQDVCLDVAHRILEMIHSGKPFAEIFVPTMCYHRSQLGNLLKDDGSYNPDFTMKDRMVEGVDGGTGLIEAKFGSPVYELLKRSCSSYAGGKSPEEQRWLIRQWRRNKNWLSTDFSKFDMHLPAWLIFECFNILKEKYFSKEYWIEIDWVAYNFVNTVMITAEGTIVRKNKGIPSGSYFTQIVGTMANLLMNLAAMCKETGKQSVHDMVSEVERELYDERMDNWRIMAMGDDCVRFSHKAIHSKSYIARVSEYITKTFGVTVKPEKSDAGNTTVYPKFLKREWRDGGEYQEPKQLLINLIHNERERKYDVYSPWHIIYGMYVTYKRTFEPYITEKDLISKMQQSVGGLEAILELNSSEMPGVLRGLGENSIDMLYERALKLAS